jgi:hypothetical protein
MTIAISGTTGITLDGQFNSASSMGFKNRIINGAMAINQRAFNGTAVDGGFTLDRWQTYLGAAGKFTVSQSSTAPTGFKNSLLATSSSAYTSLGATEVFTINQNIEGYNFSDFEFGTANAQSVTLSFRVYSSLTGTFGGSLVNSAFSRTCPFSYSIPTANTWTTVSVTIAGDTTGTWVTDNGLGLRVLFAIGAGSSRVGTAGVWSSNLYLSATGATNLVSTNGATFYITGVQLEKGSTATSFDYVDYGRTLIQCQRYFQKYISTNGTLFRGLPQSGTSGTVYFWMPFAVVMRTLPTMSVGTPIYSAMSSAAWGNIGQDGAEISGTVTGTSSFMFITWTSTAEL